MPSASPFRSVNLEHAALADANDPLYRDDWNWERMVTAGDVERTSAKVLPFSRRGAVEVVLWRLRDRKLSVPLVVYVEDTADGVVISNEALNMWGTGEDRYRAIEDFVQTFLDVFETYRDTPPQQLTADAARYLEKLREHFGDL